MAVKVSIPTALRQYAGGGWQPLALAHEHVLDHGVDTAHGQHVQHEQARARPGAHPDGPGAFLETPARDTCDLRPGPFTPSKKELH
mgnify:CR=1 FL=1